MRWPWQKKPEARQSFGQAIIDAYLDAATVRNPSDAGETAALEAAAGITGRAFAEARVEAVPSVRRALTPDTLELIARNMIRRGESLHVISMRGAALELIPAGSWYVRGGPSQSSWYVRADQYAASEHKTVIIPWAQAVHCRYAVLPSRPWIGVGPLGFASSSAALAGRLDLSLANESRAASAYLLPVPSDGGDGGDDDSLAQLKNDIGAANGKNLLVETTAAGFGEGRQAAPQRDWQQNRIGPDWPGALRETRRDAFNDCLAACGCSPALFDDSDGTSKREALRQFFLNTVNPMARKIEFELSSKLDAEIALRFDLYNVDLVGRTQSFKRLVDAGVDKAEAMRICGLA